MPTFEATLTCVVLKNAILQGDSREAVLRSPGAHIVSSNEVEQLSIEDVCIEREVCGTHCTNLPSEEPHACPFKGEYEDYKEVKCNCCASCTSVCAYDL